MAVIDQQALNGARTYENLFAAVVVSASAEMRKRITAALEAQDLQPLAVLDSPTAVEGLDTDESAIVVFVCDVDVSRQVTSLRRLCREPNVPAVVVISPPATGAGVRRTLDAGADALVFEPELESALVTTIRAVASGQTVVPRKLRASVERPSLSHREHQVVALVRRGLTNAEIAERLYLAESTVKSHLASVFTKLGVHSRKEAVTVFTDLEMTPVAMPEPAEFEHSPEQTPA
jgi:DNA-binding NarL/FixJ family response regulator